MNQKFDFLKRRVAPIITLCNPSEEELFILNGIVDREVVLKYNDVSQFTFKAYRYSNNREECEYYKYLETRRLVKIYEVGIFVITSVSKSGNGVFESKSITAQSLQKEIARKNIGYLDGTFKFYDPLKPSGTLLSEIMKCVPNWTIGYVDPSVMLRYRTFKITSDMSVYNFMMSEVEESYQCIFKFDSFNKTISVYAVENAITKTDILFTYQNLIKSIEINESEEELATAMDVYGAGDVDIRKVNPLGTASIYDFSYYKNLKWMSQGLIDALTIWENKIEQNQATYTQTLDILKTKNRALLSLNTQLKELENELIALNTLLSTQVTGGQTTGSTTQKISECTSNIQSKKLEIQNLDSEISLLNKELDSINKKLSFDICFTSSQLEELSRFIIQNTYTDDTFLVTENMTTAESQEVSQNLYNQAKTILKRVAQPRYTFSCDVVNFLNLLEFKDFIEQLELGCEVTVDMGDETCSYPVLLEVAFNYDDDSRLQLTFGNRLRLQSDDFIFEELFGKTIGVSSTIDHEKHAWGNGGTAGGKVDSIINSALDASKNTIISNSNAEVLIDNTGIRCRKYIEETDSYAPNECWITQNTIGFTRDNWKTAGMAIGEIDFNGQKLFGVVADALIGRMLIGQQMLIENGNSSFKVDGDSVTLRNANLYVSYDGGKEETLESYINSKDSIISSELEEAVSKVYGDMETMKEAIEDGVIEIFYQSSTPTGAKEGDLWYNTGKKNEASIFKGGGWETIQDKNIIDALANANTAQQTADGKIKSYYQTNPPTGLTAKDVGDLWVDTDNNNHLHRWSGTAWIDCSDTGINSATANSIKDAQDKANEALTEAETAQATADGKIDTFYQNEPPNIMANSIGDLWIDTNDGNKLYRCDGSKWVEIQDKKIQEALLNASNAQTTADGKITTFYASTMPSNGRNGDLWIHTGQKNKLYRHNGSTFVPVQDGAITDANNNANNALDKVNGVVNADGSLNKDKLIGDVLAGKSNIVCSNDTSGNKVVLNENGIIIGTRQSNGQWVGRTAINANGVYADNITAGATITGANITGGIIQGDTSISLGDKQYDSVSYDFAKGKRMMVYNKHRICAEIGSDYQGYKQGYLKCYRRDDSTSGTGIMASTIYSAYGVETLNAFNIEAPQVLMESVGVTGEKNAIVPTQHYGARKLYCDESDRAYFTTKGLANTTANYCKISLDPIFIETIELNSTCPYIINLTAYSNARVWIEDTQDDHFIVGSDVDTKFSYVLNATRITFANKYLEETNTLDSKQLINVQREGVNRMSI